MVPKVSAGITPIHEKYMKEALKQAKKALALGEVPIGCVIVHEGKIIGRGYNRRNTDKNTLAHAEITAINKASKKDWRLAAGGVYPLCHLRALPDVRRSHHPGPDPPGSHGLHESQSRLRRLHLEYPGNASI